MTLSSTDTCAERYRCYRAALSLNNTTVYLLERGHYAHALERAREAVQCMLCVIRGEGEEAVAASQQNSHPAIRVQPTHWRQYGRTMSTRIETVFFDDNKIPFLCHCRPGVPATADASPVAASPLGRLRPARIEPSANEISKSENGPSRKVLDLHMTLLLSNFALSSYLLSTATTEAEQVSKLLESTRRAFELISHSIADQFSALDDPVGEVWLMVVALVVVGNLCQIHLERGSVPGIMDCELHRSNESYRTIYMKLRQTRMAEWLAISQANCAAPAA